MADLRWSGVLAGALVALGTTLMACSGDGSTSTTGDGPPTVRVRITSTASETSGMNGRAARFSAAAGVSTLGVGEASPDHLEYFLTSIRLCESLETNGTAFNNPEGCVELYSNQSVDYATYSYTEARADATPGRYFDLMDPTTMTALNASVQVQPGTYRWALATWNRPVRVQATIPLSGGGSLYTKDGDPEGSDYKFTRASTDLNVGPSELAVTDLNNGGTWFRLQQPVVIPENGGAYTLSLAFNPDRLIKASASGASNASIQDNSVQGQGIYVPLLDLTPVLHRSDEGVRKESYILTGQDQFSIRLELYSVDADPEHAILGADVKTLYTSGTTLNLMHPSKISFLSTANDGSITFEMWDQSPVIDGFTRSGSGGTATLHCQAAFYSTDACGGAATVSLTYAAPEVATLP